MAPLQWLSRASKELGLSTVLAAKRDVHIVLLTRMLRMMAYGASTLVLALFFSALGNSEERIGLFMSLTLVGDVMISLLLTLVADSLGRRKVIFGGAMLMAFSGTVFAVTSNYWIQLLAAIVGVISPSGNEIGPFRAVEESTLAKLSQPETRSDIFAWYVVVGAFATAVGNIACGWATQTLQQAGWSDISSYRFVFIAYAVIGLLKATATLLLSKECEVEEAPSKNSNGAEESDPLLQDQSTGSQTPAAQPKGAEKTKAKPKVSQLSASARSILYKFCCLACLDSFASGMAPISLLALFMDNKFGMPEGELGSILGSSQLVAGISNIFASSLARRIGYIKTMAFTHLPSAIFLGLIPIPTSLTLTVMLIVGRWGLATMDQGPRSAFLSAAVRPEERTAVLGITGIVRTASQSLGPFTTGILAGGGHFWVAFVTAGSMKAVYDVGLLSMFASMRMEGDKSDQAQSEIENDPEQGERSEQDGGGDAGESTMQGDRTTQATRST